MFWCWESKRWEGKNGLFHLFWCWENKLKSECSVCWYVDYLELCLYLFHLFSVLLSCVLHIYVMGLCCQSCCKWFCCVMVVSWIVCLVVEIQNSWVCWFRCCSAHGYFVINSESNEHWLRGRSSVNCCPWCHFKSKRLFATMGSSLIVMPVPFAFGFKLLICMVTSWLSKEFSFMMRNMFSQLLIVDKLYLGPWS